MRRNIPLLAVLLFCLASLFLGVGGALLWVDSQSALPQAPQIEEPAPLPAVTEPSEPETAQPEDNGGDTESQPADSAEPEETEPQPEGDPVMDLTGATLETSATRASYEDSSMRLVIPKLEIDLPVLNGTGVSTLLRGVGLYEGSQLPTEADGNVSIAGHRNDIRHGKVIDTFPFYRLNTLTEGDYLYLVYQETVYRYQWEGTWVIEPSDWTVIDNQGHSCLTLTTCTPIGVADHRLVVRGELVDTYPADTSNAFPSNTTAS